MEMMHNRALLRLLSVQCPEPPLLKTSNWCSGDELEITTASKSVFSNLCFLRQDLLQPGVPGGLDQMSLEVPFKPLVPVILYTC